MGRHWLVRHLGAEARSHSAEAAHGLRTWYANSLRAALRRSRESLWPRVLHHHREHTCPPPPAPSPTTPPLAKMPGSWCCSPISDSSAAPLKSVRTACGQRRGQAAFCTLDQPSQQQPQSRGLCAQANTMPLPVNFSPLGSFSLTNLKRLGGAGSQTHSRKSL